MSSDTDNNINQMLLANRLRSFFPLDFFYQERDELVPIDRYK